MISGHEVPVFLERVFPDQGVSDVELALLRVYWSLGFVSDQVTIKLAKLCVAVEHPCHFCVCVHMALNEEKALFCINAL